MSDSITQGWRGSWRVVAAARWRGGLISRFYQRAIRRGGPRTTTRARRYLGWLAILIVGLSVVRPVSGQEKPNAGAKIELPAGLAGGPEQWTSPEGLSSTLQVMLLLTVISLAPSVLLMTTCFVRILVVFGLLRQALGTQQLPPSQVLTSISLFLTLLVMMPVWKQVYDRGSGPLYAAADFARAGLGRRRAADPPLHGPADPADRQ